MPHRPRTVRGRMPHESNGVPGNRSAISSTHITALIPITTISGASGSSIDGRSSSFAVLTVNMIALR